MKKRVLIIFLSLLLSACQSPSNGFQLGRDWVENTPAPPTALSGKGTVYLTDIPWQYASNGYGPVERDRSNGSWASGDGQPIQLAGVKLEKGLGVYAYSEIRYELGGSCERFQAQINTQDGEGSANRVTFRVLLDNDVEKFSHLAVAEPRSVNTDVDVNLKGVRTLRLLVSRNGSSTDGSAVWGNARIVCPDPNAVTTLEITSSSATLAAGSTQRLTTTAKNSFGDPIAPTLTWSVSDSTKASIDETGLLTALNPGAITVTATTQGKTASAAISITPDPSVVATFELNPTSATLVTGNTQQFSATAKNASGVSLTPTLSWSVSDESKASVSSSGLVTALATGSITLIVQAGDKSASAAVSITAPPPDTTVAMLEITPVTMSVNAGSTQQFSTSAKNAAGVSLNPPITWSVSDTTKASISATGLFSAKAVGTLTVTASGGGKTVSANVTINPSPSSVATLSITPATSSVNIGGTQQFSASAKNASDTATTPTPIFNWSVSDPSKASISSSGVLSATAAGTVTVTVSAGGKTSSASLTISAAQDNAVATLTIAPASFSVTVGGTQNFTASAKNAAGVTLTPTLTWAVSDPSKGSVSSAGLFTALATGSVNVTVSAGGKTATAGGSVNPSSGAINAPLGTLSSFGTYLPPVGAVLARSYGTWVPDTKHDSASYKTCTKEQHDRYWVVGKPNGKIYPTWHPPFEANASGQISCYYGHEHGLDPRDYPRYDKLLALRGGVPFGLVNEHYADHINNPLRERSEDHTGQKIEFARYRAAYGNAANGGDEASSDDLYDAGFDCDLLMKLHMGTHSVDAFTNHLHELIQTLVCTDGTEYSIALLKPFGVGGQFDMGTSGSTRMTGITPQPSGVDNIGFTGAIGNGGSGSGDKREIPTTTTFNTWNIFGGLDIWSTNTNLYWKNSTSGDSSLGFGPYLSVFNPSRVYNMAHDNTAHSTANMMTRTVDLCYTANGTRKGDTLCTMMPSVKPAWDSPDSTFNGTWRNINFKSVNIYNSAGPSKLYLSYMGDRLQTTPFAGSMEIYVAAVDNGWGWCNYPNGTKVPTGVSIPKACKVAADRTVLQGNITGSLVNARQILGDPNGKYKGLGFTKEYVVNHNYYPPVYGVPGGPLNPAYRDWNSVDTSVNRPSGVHAPN